MRHNQELKTTWLGSKYTHKVQGLEGLMSFVECIILISVAFTPSGTLFFWRLHLVSKKVTLSSKEELRHCCLTAHELQFP